jgi:hypothetical protein
MTALANQRVQKLKRFTTKDMAATASVTYYQGALICIDTSTGLVCQGKASTTLHPIGTCARTVTLGAGGGTVSVNLFREVVAIWMINDAGAPLVSTDIGGLAYIKDDQTVQRTDATNTLSILGMVWELDTNKGALVECFPAAADPNLSGLDG